ncbi:hypothetical protein OIY81_1340 [Cryptosporidium canis]|uniref:Uncharacterized protein n=1 Tax=Cryptosporidium canis TaxID=195482 RepID=A0ABQ8P2L5_9CRYT|nr:hypothetical protein OJ252_3344 [Cryptosporidium canis]KAJ1612256.1 hypothetical protein OIY81_1340 [Cryptosporidium canis]
MEETEIITSEKNGIFDEYCDLQYECKNSGIILVPSQINELELKNSSDLVEHSDSQHEHCVVGSVVENNEVCIFDEALSNNLFEEGILCNSTPIPTIIESGTKNNASNVKKSPTIKTSSSITFLSKTVGIKKRKLIVPPIIYGKRLRSEHNKLKIQDSIPSKPKRRLKLKGNDYVKEYSVYRDEDYGKTNIKLITRSINHTSLGIIDNTDQLLLNGENVHRQDDDRQTTSEVQDWAIGLVKRYLGETVRLMRQESLKVSTRSDRIRNLRQRFGFPAKVRDL